MSTQNSMASRIQIIFVLIISFLMVLGTNRIDKSHFETAQNALTTLHNDRVIAQDYLFDMNTIVHKKQLQLTNPFDVTADNTNNNRFEKLITLFYKTQLTTKESNILKALDQNFKNYKIEEQQFTSQGPLERNANEAKNLSLLLDDIEVNIQNLSTIQVSESSKTTGLAQKSLDNNSMLATMEITFLFIIGVALLFAIFYSPKIKKKLQSKSISN